MTPQNSAGGCCLAPEDLEDPFLDGTPPLGIPARGCPECRARLDALRRLEALSAELLQEDIRAAGAGDQSWLEEVLANLGPESKAGRSVPPAGTRPDGGHGNGVQDSGRFRTEGSILSLIRATGDSVDGTIIGKCRLQGELATAQAPVRVEVSVTALWGYPLPGLAADLRATLSGALADHTDLNVAAIDIVVTDLLDAPPGRAGS